jgi:hypothetical protein
MPYPVLNTLSDGGYPKGAFNYWKSAFLSEPSDAAAEIMVDAMRLVSQWTDPRDTGQNIAWAKETFAALRPYMTGRTALVNAPRGEATPGGVCHLILQSRRIR